MQLTVTKAQFVQMCKMELDGVKFINPAVLAKAEIRERAGDYKDAQGNPVIRTTIILPTYEKTVKAEDYLKGVTGTVVDKAKEAVVEAPVETPAETATA